MSLGYSRILIGLIAVALTVAGVIFGLERFKADQQRIGEQRSDAKCATRENQLKDQALREYGEKLAESKRRLEAQQENERAKDAEIARLREAADRNAAHAQRLQRDFDAAAREWRARLADSPTAQDLQAAGAALAVCADVRGRLDQAAGVLAAYAGAARAAGLKCEADYDALKPTR